jgi:hypothetical protein
MINGSAWTYSHDDRLRFRKFITISLIGEGSD